MSSLYPAGQTPYCTDTELVAAPSGISWSSIPAGRDVTDEQRLAERVNILGRATARVDGYCNQPLRATSSIEQLTGPDFRVVVQNSTGNARIILSRWPILSITSVKVSPNVFPRSWTTLPSGYYDVEHPALGLYDSVAPSASGGGGQSIVIAPGYLDWRWGRNGYVVRVADVNGWPHCSTTAAVAVGATSIPVDDCTGWAVTGETGTVGSAGVVYDSGSQETVLVSAASVASGPGNLTIPSPGMLYGHPAGVMITALPQSAIDATILFSVAAALVRGATSTTVRQIPGGAGGVAGAGGKSPPDLIKEAKALIHPFRRTV